MLRSVGSKATHDFSVSARSTSAGGHSMSICDGRRATICRWEMMSAPVPPRLGSDASMFRRLRSAKHCISFSPTLYARLRNLSSALADRASDGTAAPVVGSRSVPPGDCTPTDSWRSLSSFTEL